MYRRKHHHFQIAVVIYREIFLSVRCDAKPTQTDTNRTENRIIELIRENQTITRVEFVEKMELHESSVQRRLEALAKEAKLRHIGPTNGGIWKVIE